MLAPGQGKEGKVQGAFRCYLHNMEWRSAQRLCRGESSTASQCHPGPGHRANHIPWNEWKLHEKHTAAFHTSIHASLPGRRHPPRHLLIWRRRCPGQQAKLWTVSGESLETSTLTPHLVMITSLAPAQRGSSIRLRASWLPHLSHQLIYQCFVLLLLLLLQNLRTRPRGFNLFPCERLPSQGHAGNH